MNQGSETQLAPILRKNVGKRLSDACVFGGLAFLAGQVPIQTRGGAIESQTREVLSRIDALLAELGTDRSRIVTCQIFLRDIDEIAPMNAAWDEWVPKDQTPARATVQAALADPGWRIEVVVVAALNPEPDSPRQKVVVETARTTPSWKWS